MGWYYVTLAVDGKICTHLETGLNHDISDGKVGDIITADYPQAGTIFQQCGFSLQSTLYTVPCCGTMRGNVPKRRWPSAAPPRGGKPGMGAFTSFP